MELAKVIACMWALKFLNNDMHWKCVYYSLNQQLWRKTKVIVSKNMPPYGLSPHRYLQHQLAMLWERQSVSFMWQRMWGKELLAWSGFGVGTQLEEDIWEFSINTFTFYLCSSSSFTINFNQAFSLYTVEPLNRGHFGTVAFVLSSEVVLFSEVV